MSFIPIIFTAMMLVACGAEQPRQAPNNDADTSLPLLLTDEQQAYQLGPHVAMLEDPEKQWTIEDVSSPEFARRFVPSEGDELQIGFGDSAYWVRIQLQNSGQRSEWWLEHANAAIWYLDLYTPRPDGSGFEHAYQTGLLRPFTSQDISALTYVLPFTISPLSTQTLYLRYEHSRATRLPLLLWSPAAFARQNQLNMWQLTTIFTINILLFSGLLMIWIRMRSQPIFYFMLAIGTMLVITTLERGIGRQYLWPNLNLGSWYPYLNNIGAVILFLSALKFTTLFLDTKQQLPNWHKVLQALMILMLLVMIQIPLVAEYIINLQITGLYLLGLLILIVLGIYAWIRTYRYSEISRTTSLIFITFLMLGIVGVLGRNGFLPFLEVDQIFFFLILTYVALLSVFIANYLFTTFKKQREAQRRQEESALALQKANEELEQRVLDRTRKLSILFDVTSIANRGLDLKTTMAQCLDRVLAGMNGSAGAIHLLDETGQILHLASTQGLSSEVQVEIEELPTDKGLTSQVLKQEEILIVPDLAKDPRALLGASQDNLQSYAGIPIRASGAILGVLAVARQRGQPVFNDQEIDLLGSIADQVGVVVESSLLREKTKQAAIMEERQRLARELHDSVTQSLHSANLIAGALPLKWANDPEEGRRGLDHLQRFIQGALAEMRTLLLELYPAALEERDLPFLLLQLADAMMARTQAVVTTSVSGEGTLPKNVHVALYRITQEALNNVVKHAGARKVRVNLQFAGARPGADDEAQVVLSIMDDGRGFDIGDIQSTGLGIGMMRDRAREINASLSVTSRPDLGTEILVEWPDSGTYKLDRSDHKPAERHKELVNGDEP